MQTNTYDLKRTEGFLSAMNPSSAARAIDVATRPNVTSLVFVVDDEVSVRESLELLMGAEGWRVETFASAADFVSRPRVTVPCCLVLDVRLRGHGGLELQRQLPAGPRSRSSSSPAMATSRRPCRR